MVVVMFRLFFCHESLCKKVFKVHRVSHDGLNYTLATKKISLRPTFPGGLVGSVLISTVLLLLFSNVAVDFFWYWSHPFSTVIGNKK